MAQTLDTLESLAFKVAELTATITSYLNSEGLPQPSFAADSPAQYPAVPEITEPRMILIQSLSDMLHLALGGRDYIFTQSISVWHRPVHYPSHPSKPPRIEHRHPGGKIAR